MRTKFIIPQLMTNQLPKKWGKKKGEKKPNNPETTVVQMTQYIPWSLDHKKD